MRFIKRRDKGRGAIVTDKSYLVISDNDEGEWIIEFDPDERLRYCAFLHIAETVHLALWGHDNKDWIDRSVRVVTGKTCTEERD